MHTLKHEWWADSIPPPLLPLIFCLLKDCVWVSCSLTELELLLVCEYSDTVSVLIFIFYLSCLAFELISCKFVHFLAKKY